MFVLFGHLHQQLLHVLVSVVPLSRREIRQQVDQEVDSLVHVGVFRFLLRHEQAQVHRPRDEVVEAKRHQLVEASTPGGDEELRSRRERVVRVHPVAPFDRVLGGGDVVVDQHLRTFSAKAIGLA